MLPMNKLQPLEPGLPRTSEITALPVDGSVVTEAAFDLLNQVASSVSWEDGLHGVEVIEQPNQVDDDGIRLPKNLVKIMWGGIWSEYIKAQYIEALNLAPAIANSGSIYPRTRVKHMVEAAELINKHPDYGAGYINVYPDTTGLLPPNRTLQEGETNVVIGGSWCTKGDSLDVFWGTVIQLMTNPKADKHG